MKNPSMKGWLAIIGAVLALILSLASVFGDGILTAEEAQDVSTKVNDVIQAVQQETAEEVTP